MPLSKETIKRFWRKKRGLKIRRNRVKQYNQKRSVQNTERKSYRQEDSECMWTNQQPVVKETKKTWEYNMPIEKTKLKNQIDQKTWQKVYNESKKVLERT